MAATKVKPKAKFSLRRKLTPARLERLKNIKIKSGDTDYDDYCVDKQLCIMESVNLMMHGEAITFGGDSDKPPCVSEVITEYMIDLNDDVDDKQRQALKKLATEIVGTCPTKWEKNQKMCVPTFNKRTGRTGSVLKNVDLLVRDFTPEYQATEALRRCIVNDDFYGSYERSRDDDYWNSSVAELDAYEKFQALYNSEKMANRLKSIRMLVDPLKSFSKNDLKRLEAVGLI